MAMEELIDNNIAEEPRLPKIDALGRSYATGKRKNSIAKVWIKAGTGKITVNNLDYKTYFKRSILHSIITTPLVATQSETSFDVTATVLGGGLSGQAGAIRHGISKALDYYNPSYHKTLKSLGLLTRDSRVVESKKYGHRKARRSFQFSKR